MTDEPFDAVEPFHLLRPSGRRPRPARCVLEATSPDDEPRVSDAVTTPLPGGILVGVLGAAWTLLLSLVLGAALLGRLDREPDGSPRAGLDAIVGWIVMGFAIQSLAWLGLSQLGALDAATLPLFAALLLVAATVLARPALSAALRNARRLRLPGRPTPESAVGFLLLTGFLVGVAWLASRPTLFYDDLVYHLGLPRQALLTGSWPALPDLHYSFMPGGWDAGFLLTFALGSAAGAQFLNVATLALLAVAVTRLGRVAGGATRGPAVLAAALLLLCPMAASLGSFAGNDLFVALALTASMTRVLHGPGGARGAWTAGLLAGAAWSAKYTALPGAAACGLAWLLVRGEGPLGPRAREAGGFAFGVVLPAAAWNLRAWLLTGNPLYPAFFGLLGGRHWNAESAALVTRDVSHGAASTEGPRAFLSGGWRLLTDAPGMGHPAGVDPLLPWLGLAALLGAARARHRLVLAAAALLVYVAWCATSLNQRYALFLLVLLAAAAAALLERVLTMRRLVRFAMLGVVGVAAAVQGAEGLAGHLEFYRAQRVDLDEPRSEMLAEFGAWRAGRDLDGLLPEDAGLLVVGEGRIALLPRPVLASSAYDRPVVAPLLEGAPSLADMTARARGAGVTHVVVNHSELARWIAGYRWEERLPEGGLERLRDWTRAELLPVGRWGPVDVWALPPP